MRIRRLETDFLLGLPRRSPPKKLWCSKIGGVVLNLKKKWPINFRRYFFQGLMEKKSACKISYVGTTPHPVTVTTRISPFLVGNPYKPSFVTVTGWGVDRNHMSFLFLRGDENLGWACWKNPQQNWWNAKASKQLHWMHKKLRHSSSQGHLKGHKRWPSTVASCLNVFPGFNVWFQWKNTSQV